ncbi:TPA: RHS repeat-associated core domain-containing protein [Proteus mirabilis]
MTKLNRQLYSRTPAVVVYDNRRLAVREIEYCRHPDSINQTDERITRHHYHARGYLAHSIDARLYEAQHSDPTIQPNFQQILSLGGAFSFSQYVDKGNNVNISDIENRISLNINAMKLVTEYQYTKPELVSQLIAIIEHTANSHPVLKEHFIWGMADSKNIANNAVGKCIRHEDLAGRTEYDGYTLTGKNINELRIVTANAVKMNENSLNTQELSFKTSNFYDATGNLLRQIDASNHQREWDYDRAGFLKQSRVILHGTNKFFVIKAISYSAAGQKLRVEQGNGLVTTYEYETETQRLLHVKTQRPQGHALGMRVIQDLRYEYDPVGNVICLKNDAEATRYWRNQKVVPENRYVYDSLYQLVSATGRELTNQHTPASIQSQTITTLVKDAQSYTNYTRLYTYDRSGNLIKIRHHSLLAQQSFTQNICVSLRSNRALLENQHTVIGNIDEHFDAMGNQQQLSTEAILEWDHRGTLAQVKSNNGNVERYIYANQSQRLMKQQVRHLSGHYITSETYYLPNMEIWQSKRGAQVIEQREVLILMDNVRALLWKTGLPHGIKNNQLRYSYNDGTGNSGLETDGQGQLVSYEEYYPYGGTAIWSSESALEANYKTIRYSGKERDSTGLYYYGYRYYQPWIGRWLSADPAGTVDGLNLYRMVRNNPVTLRDPDGRAPSKPNNFVWVKGKEGEKLNFAGMSLFSMNTQIDEKARYLAKKGIKVVVSLDTKEYEKSRQALLNLNIDSVKYPIPDWTSPSINQLYKYNELLDKYNEYNLATHCWGGYGRTGVFLASRLIHNQEVQSAQEAMALIRQHYSAHAIEMKVQYNALARYADSYALSPSAPLSSLNVHWDNKHGNDGLEFDPGHKGDPTDIFYDEADMFDLSFCRDGAFLGEADYELYSKYESSSDEESEDEFDTNLSSDESTYSGDAIDVKFLGMLSDLKIQFDRNIPTTSL